MEVVKDPNISREDMLVHMVTQYEVSLLRTCYMYLRDKGLAEDATQETFLKAYKALPTFRGECSDKTWLMRIAMNTCRDMMRNPWFRFIDRRVTVDSLPESAAETELYAADDLTQAILDLPIKDKEVILLYYYQDMSMREISVALDIAISTVNKRIKRACGKLKNMLGKEYAYEF